MQAESYRQHIRLGVNHEECAKRATVQVRVSMLKDAGFPVKRRGYVR